MSLKKSFFFLTLCGLLISLLLLVLLWSGCLVAASRYPSGGVVIGVDGVVTELPGPTPEQYRVVALLNHILVLCCILFPVLGLAGSGALFYRWKLKRPIMVLMEGTKRIQVHDLEFAIPEISGDELGLLCAAFETMRVELKKTNQELWRQAEERKRLNAAFAHDLRNPVTVLKGSVTLLRQDANDVQALDRLERYTLRIERYIEAMSGIQRLEQLPVRFSDVTGSTLRAELEETARLLAPGLERGICVSDVGHVQIDHGICLTVAENLIGNAARFARKRLEIVLSRDTRTLTLSVADDGPGFPAELLKNGPRPFGKHEDNAEHFGMGLYSSNLLCLKHGGTLRFENRAVGGAAVTATFQINRKV